ncbi:1,2-dihydroxy-3-keto-5-methylthiopentene dioxygenase [Malassezia sp. CBS 17886]|nr:1,2-dihydroxy-3-keto-5-methylthiopentene dioxygenase [Malassezia sp. CBS 17886]
MDSYSANGTAPQGAAGPDNGHQAPPEYTLSGILHFLQSEWRRYERDRNSWAIERAELRARIALLEGERRGVENVKTDLMRRIKLLDSPQSDDVNGSAVLPASDASRAAFGLPGAAANNVKLPLGVKDAKSRAKSRAYLQQCLEEISYLTNASTLNPLASHLDGPEPSAVLPQAPPQRPRFMLPEALEARSEDDAGRAGAAEARGANTSRPCRHTWAL